MTTLTGHLCRIRLGLVGPLTLLLVCACQASISPSDGVSTNEPLDSTQPNFVLLLYPDGSFDPKIDLNGVQPGLVDAANSSPFDTLTEVDLVGANWSERTLIFGSTVRQRYDESGYPSLPICQFVLEFKGTALFGGDVVNSISARAIRYPVAVYDFRDSNTDSNDTVILRLMSRYGIGFRNDKAPFPGLSSESDGEIGRYLSDTVSRNGP